MRRPNKKTTFSFFDYKWSRAPQWAMATESIYRKWYLERYGYKTMGGMKRFLRDKKMVMEAGCGLARDSKMFAELNPSVQILAVDQSPQAVEVATRDLRSFKNCKVLRADITNFSTKHKFDFISCDQVIHHTPEVDKTLKHLFNKLKNGGVINFSVCRKKNEMRDLVDDLIMKKAAEMPCEALWEFSKAVTISAKALYDLDIRNVKFNGKKYDTLQRFIHDNLFRAWYNTNIPFELSVSSNYDWFSGNPRFNAEEVRSKVLNRIKNYKLLRFYEDDATISVSLQRL